MGYRSRAFGTIEFDPPVPAEDLRTAANAVGDYGYWLGEPMDRAARDALANATPVVGEVWEGARVSSVELGDDDESKMYEVELNLQNLLAALPDTQITGSIQVEGEEQGDVERILFEGRTVSIQQAQIAWGNARKIV